VSHPNAALFFLDCFPPRFARGRNDAGRGFIHRHCERLKAARQSIFECRIQTPRFFWIASRVALLALAMTGVVNSALSSCIVMNLCSDIHSIPVIASGGTPRGNPVFLTLIIQPYF